MPYETRPMPTSVLVCDICGEEIPETTYRGGSDHRGEMIRENGVTRGGGGTEIGSVLFGWVARQVSNFTRHAYLTWPPPSWSRTKKWDERPPERRYDFHGECILALVEKAVAERTSAIALPDRSPE